MPDDTVETAAGEPGPPAVVVARRYRLGEPLGQGAVANVYRAVDTRLDRDVAVKVFHPGQEAAARARFGAEAQALARLSHPGLVGIYDAGVDDDRPYLVMQLVDGESLRERLLGGPLTTGEVIDLGVRLAAALSHVHANDVVHRDVKPSNIVLDAAGSPYLADFGIALLLDVVRVTGANEIMGTAAYLAPEQILSEPVGAAADVYSLGLVLLECLTGELEYPGVSRVESALARLHRPPRVPDGIPAALADLLTAMTARTAANRPGAAECAKRLAAIGQRVTAARARRLAVRRVVGDRLTDLAHTRPAARSGGYRATAPLLSGWRRFVLAGSGLAMAIVASTWLFTSLMPRMAPQPAAETPLRQQSAPGGPSQADIPQLNVPRGDSAQRVAASVTSNGTVVPNQPEVGDPGAVGGSITGTTALSASDAQSSATNETDTLDDTTVFMEMSTDDSSTPTDGTTSDVTGTDTVSGTPTDTTTDSSSADSSTTEPSTTEPPTTTTKPTRTLR
jgi:tRNA A-37 threonylcarbamoyl transferase component Bud32